MSYRTPARLDAVLANLAGRQKGTVTREQLLAHPGIYLVGHRAASARIRDGCSFRLSAPRAVEPSHRRSPLEGAGSRRDLIHVTVVGRTRPSLPSVKVFIRSVSYPPGSSADTTAPDHLSLIDRSRLRRRASVMADLLSTQRSSRPAPRHRSGASSNAESASKAEERKPSRKSPRVWSAAHASSARRPSKSPSRFHRQQAYCGQDQSE